MHFHVILGNQLWGSIADQKGLRGLSFYYRQVGYAYPSPDHSCCLGLCTGALAAAAVSCSVNTLELLPLAVEAMHVAFRVGMLVDNMARCIEPSEFVAHDNKKIHNDVTHGDIGTDVKRKVFSGERPSWTFLMAGSSTEEALHEFIEENNVSRTFCSQHILLRLSPPLCSYVNGTPPFLLVVLYDTPMDQRPLNWRHCRCQWPAQIFDYWWDPHRNMIEHYADGDLVNCETQITYGPAGDESLAVWGPDVPARFLA